MLIPVISVSYASSELVHKKLRPSRVFNGSMGITAANGETYTVGVTWDDANHILLGVAVYYGTTLLYQTSSPSYVGGILFGGSSLFIDSLYIAFSDEHHVPTHIGTGDYTFPVS